MQLSEQPQPAVHEERDEALNGTSDSTSALGLTDSPDREHLNRQIVRKRHPAFEIIETVLLAIVLFIGINALTARIRVDGSSMEPTLSDREFVLVNRLAYKSAEPQRGDVVIFSLAGDSREYVKRVIGLPGDQVEVRDRQVFINGAAIDEPYIAADPIYTGSWTIPEGMLFLMGDNRNNSTDSHIWGPVPATMLIGKAEFIYWPPEKWGILY